MKKTKLTTRIISLIFAAATLIVAYAPCYAVEEPKLDYSKSACVYNVDYDTFIYESDADRGVYPAGTVKLMVALLTLEHFADPSVQVTVTEEMLDGIEAANVTGFDAGEVLTVEQLLAALIVSNSNDAAIILACAVAGNTGAFLNMMNERAEQLGMENTRYLNVTGLHNERMKTTARDVLTVTLQVLKYRLFTEFAATDVYTMAATNMNAERTLHNRNYFVSSYFNLYYRLDSVNGASMSRTGEAGYCMSITAQDSDGLTYVFVVMNSSETTAGETEVHGCDDAVKLMNWAFRNYSSVAVVGTDTMVCEIPVRLSSGTDHVIALPSNKITTLLPDDTDLKSAVRTEYTLKDETLLAPVKAGQVIGELTVYVNDRKMGTVDLVAKNNVDRSFWLYLGYRAVQFVTRPAVIAAIVVVTLAVIALSVYRSARKNRRRVRFKNGS